MSKYMSWAKAVNRSKEQYEAFQKEVEESRLAECERNRFLDDTDIICGHRDNQHYIEIGEFTFQLCDDCIAMIISGLTKCQTTK